MPNTAANADREWRPETIRDLLTADRLTSYLDSCGQDLDRSLALYEWNLAASAAVLQTTAMVEVIVRNAFDTQLVAWATRRGATKWLDVIPVDTKGGHEDLRRRRRQVDHRLESLMIVRNRAAHHEPIHRRNLNRNLDYAIELAQWIHPEAGSWIAHNSNIPSATASRP